MAVSKQRKTKVKKPLKGISDRIGKKTWEKVKIKGKVISDDGGGFEGLIGLEVLENYNANLVETGKSSLSKRERKQKKKKRKAEEDAPNDESTEKSSDEEDPTIIKKKDQELKIQKKIEKKKKRREMRKRNRLTEGDVSDEQQENEVEEEYPPDRFSLLRPPPAESDSDTDVDEDEVVSELVDMKEVVQIGLNVGDLEGWNGLGVPHVILRAIAEKGFKSPTEIQAMTLPAAILGKKDILGAAETGSGKTLAFGIPILTGILELKSKNSRSGIRKAPKIRGQNKPPAEEPINDEEDRDRTPPPEELNNFPDLPTDDEAVDNNEVTQNNQLRNGPLFAVVLTPTRELAVQVKDHIAAAAKYTGIQVAAIFGGLAVAKQERLLRKCPEIVVATPGRFWELLNQENPHLSKIDDISFLVIDETDRMVEKGHFEELRLLLRLLNSDEKKKQVRQNFVFSATLTLVHDLPEHMQKRNVGKRQRFIKQTPGLKIQSLIEELGISQPKIVDVTRSSQTAQNLTECRLICPIDHKDFYLYYFIQRHPGRTIVFCNSIDCVKRLATLFGILECNVLPLHANMIQKQRLKNLERFRDNPESLLIATDVAARGLDIPNVQHVIHYQVPRTSENYVHRSGRTARASQNGITVMFMEPGEVRSYVKLYKTLDRTEDLPLFPISEKYLFAVKERVNLAREVDKKELKIRRSQSEIGWMKKNAEAMDMIIDGYDNASGSDQDEDAFIIERRRDRVHLQSVRSQLKSLLAKEIFPRGFSFKYPTSTGQLQVPHMAAPVGEESNSAVKVMKDAIEDMKLQKKLRNKKKK